MLNKLVCILILIAFYSSGSAQGDYFIRAEVDLSAWPPYPPPPDCLVYDDGTPGWITWSGTYRGVWFDPNEFWEQMLGCQVEGVELWFYHHIEYPWDTSSFFAELWQGNAMGPTQLCYQTLGTAVHYSAVSLPFDFSGYLDNGFWILINTEQSSGGWPSLICDNSGNFTGDFHSFHSEDMIVFEPWMTGQGFSLAQDFEPLSWAGIKNLFQ